MVDFFPSLCGLAGLPVPKSIEGTNLSKQWLSPNIEDSAFIMNFSKWFDWFQDGAEWRGRERERVLLREVELDHRPRRQPVRVVVVGMEVLAI